MNQTNRAICEYYQTVIRLSRDVIAHVTNELESGDVTPERRAILTQIVENRERAIEQGKKIIAKMDAKHA